MLYQYTPQDLERFLSKVPQCEGCQLTRYAPSGIGGYAQFTLYNRGHRKGVLAHRFAYSVAYGDIPKDKVVMHLCSYLYLPGDISYRRCVNPKHLKLGSPFENVHQTMLEGRAPRVGKWAIDHPESVPRGEMHHKAILIAPQVLEIRARYTGERGQIVAFAAEYGINPNTVNDIIHRRTWVHI